MGAEAAARLGDDIAHGFGLAAMVAGAVVGALVGAAIVAATAATGGLAAVIIAGAVAGGGLSMLGIVKGLTTIFDLPEPPTGKLVLGSPNVHVNSRFSMRASLDTAASCIGLPLLLGHPPLPFPVPIAEGSATVRINGMPAARLKDRLVCGAHIKSGSPDVLIGGPTERTNFVFDLEGWMKTGLEILGLAAFVGAGVLAAAAGAAALAGFAAITGAGMLAFEGLGQLGDALGPGYRDLFQGLAGMALLFASRPRSKPSSPPRQQARPQPKTREEAQPFLGTSDKVGDFSGIRGGSIQEVVSRVPEGAEGRNLKPIPGAVQEGFEFKWLGTDGQTHRIRIHGADASAPLGSNAREGWVARVQRGKKFADDTGTYHPPGIKNPDSPHYNEQLANDTHIPLQDPDVSPPEGWAPEMPSSRTLLGSVASMLQTDDKELDPK